MSNKGRVLVTGANGFIAAQTVSALLKAGYSVRGTVRTYSSASGLLQVLSEAVSDGRLEIVEVPDITAPGAFDAAVRDVTAIAHLASPVSFNFTDPEYVIGTAVNGVKTILESAAKEPNVKNFVQMSSVAAIRGEKPEGYVFTEADWNDEVSRAVAELGNKAPGRKIYGASKTESERAFWQFRETRNPHFTMTAINPVFVAGPSLALPATPDKINETTQFIWDVFSGQDLPPPMGPYVDVRDVARLVVFGLDESQKADGQRYLASAGYGTPQAAADILRRAYPDRKDIIQEGQPGHGYSPDWSYPPAAAFDTSKAVKATGQGWINFETMIIDTAKTFEAYLR